MTTADPASGDLPDSVVAEISRAVQRTLTRARISGAELEDLQQITWLRLLEQLRRGLDLESLTAYARGIARNVAREQRMARGRRQQLEQTFCMDLAALGLGGDTISAEAQCERRELELLVARAIGLLSPRERWLIDVRLSGETSYADLLPRYRELFGRSVRSEDGLRTAVFQARRRVRARVEGADRPAFVREHDVSCAP